MMEPVQVDVVTFAEETDAARVARDAMAGDGGFGSFPSDNAPVDWVFRAYAELAGTPYADRLARGVAVCLSDPDPLIRAQALIFFRSKPLAAGGERLVELAAGDRAGFAGVPDPLSPSVDLEWQLLGALGARLARRGGDDAGLAVAQAEVLRAGKARPVVSGLFDAAPEWVISHAESIVHGTPRAGITLLAAVQRSGADVVEFGRRIAPLCRGDDQFERYLPRVVDDPAARRAILEAFTAATADGDATP